MQKVKEKSKGRDGGGATLSGLQRRVFRAVAAAVCGVPVDGEVCDAAAPFLSALAPADRRAVGALLAALEVAPLVSRRPRLFSALPRERAEALLRDWSESPVPQQRQGAAAIRALALLAHYGRESAWSDLGYDGPWLGRREVRVLPGPALTPPRPPRPPARPHANPRPAVGIPPGVVQGRDAPGDLRIRAEICVIGTGAGGAAALAHAASLGVTAVAVEAGAFTHASDFDQRELHMLPHLYREAGLRATADQAIGIMQGSGVGGSTLHNTGLVFTPPEAILRRWRDDHGFELAPDDVDRRVSHVLESLGANPIPPSRINENNETLRRGAEALGWSHLVAMHNRVECSGCGYCMLGCAYNRKTDSTFGFLPAAIEAGASVLSDASVVRIDGEAGARRVVCELRDASGAPTGRLAMVEAPVVIVAGGALDSPALLLRSGLGGPRVGRGLRLHPAASVSATFRDPVIAWRGLPQSVIVDEFAAFQRNGHGGWLVLASAANVPGLAAVVMPGIGAVHRERMRALGHTASASVLLHDETEGRVRAGPDGRPRASYWPHAADRAELERGIASLARLYLAAGALRVHLPYAGTPSVQSEAELRSVMERARSQRYRIALNSVHPQSSLPMGRDPESGAVSPRGELYGAPGVFVADASIFPTSVGVPPQVTIMALAAAVAEASAGRLERWSRTP
jgi:choline dehydrogenase-like flavoprotein